MRYGMNDIIRRVTNMFDMTLVEEHIQEAMLKGKSEVYFTIDDNYTPGVNLPAGKLHSMQVVKLINYGFTVERRPGTIVVSGWNDPKSFEIPE